jgi:hypothetical protein
MSPSKSVIRNGLAKSTGREISLAGEARATTRSGLVVVHYEAVQLAPEPPSNTRQQQHRDNPDTDGESPPDTTGSQLRAESKPGAHRKTNEPESDKIQDHRYSCVTDTPQGTRPSDLQSIEDLEDAGDREKKRSRRNHSGIRAKNSGKQPGRCQKHGRSDSHEQG